MNKKLGYFELILVLSIAFLQPIINSIFLLVNPITLYTTEFTNSFMYGVFGVVTKILPILLVFLLLWINNKKIMDLGFRFTWIDIIAALILSGGAYVLLILINYLLTVLGKNTVPNVDPSKVMGSRNLFTFLAVIINPFTEEIIVRAYAINKVEELTKNTLLAAMISVLVQFSYHLYQGYVSALLLLPIFIIYTVFYIKFRKIWPIIISHLAFDLIAFFSMPK